MPPFLAVCLTLLAASPAHADPPESAMLHYTQGLLLEGQGDYAGAMKEYTETTDLDPKAGYVFRREAELALDLGDLDKALAKAQRALQLEGPTPQGYRVLGNVQWARGDSDAAKDAFEKALSIDPRFEDAMLALANLNAASDPAAAEGYYRKVLAADPSNAGEAYYQIALIEEHQGDVDAAEADLRRSLDADPDHLQARYALAQLFEVHQDTPSALAQYQEILVREPKNPGVWVRVGEIQGLMNDMVSAEASFRRAKEIQPDNPGASFWLAQLAEGRNDFAAAADALKDSAQLSSDPKLNLRLSFYLAQAGRAPDSVRVLEAAYKKWPKDLEIGYYLALGYDDQGKTQQAIDVLKPVVDAAPQSRDARFELGALYEKADRMADSEREFDVLIASRPDDAQALNYLGYSLADRGLKLPEAEAMIQKAVAAEPGNGAYLDSLAWVHFRLGRSTEAVAELKDALRALPNDDSVWDHVGDVYEAMSDSGTAWSAWKYSQRLNPANAKLEPKLKAAAGTLSDDALGGRMLEFLRSSQGSVKSVLASATVTGKVGPHTFTFSGLLHFQRSTEAVSAAVDVSSEAALALAPGAVRIEMLGPMFFPVWRAYLGPDDNFVMDPLDIQGLDQGNVAGAVEAALHSLRDYMSGALFNGPGRYHKGWTKTYVETPSQQLYPSANELYLQSSRSRRGGGELALSNFQNVHGHPLPRILELSGPGYSVRIQLDGSAAEFYDVPPHLP